MEDAAPALSEGLHPAKDIAFGSVRLDLLGDWRFRAAAAAGLTSACPSLALVVPDCRLAVQGLRAPFRSLCVLLLRLSIGSHRDRRFSFARLRQELKRPLFVPARRQGPVRQPDRVVRAASCFPTDADACSCSRPVDSLQSQPPDQALRFTGPLDCFQQTWRKEGLRGLYRVRALVPDIISLSLWIRR
jgi:hypothetical protein